MDINTQNSSGMMNGMPPVPPTNPPEKKVGPIVGALIIIIILVVAGFYFFNKKLNLETPAPAENVTTSEETENTPAIEQTSAVGATQTNTTKSDDLDSLTADLDAQLKDVDYSF